MAESSSSGGTPNNNEEPQVIRYSKEFLLSLHDSPLAVKPDNFPGLSLWFGDDWQSLNTKGALNGSTSPKTLDKNIVLGPPKTSFNSSVFGGLKHSEDATQAGKSGSSYTSNRPRQGHESRTPRDNNNADSRSQRVSHNMNERTFGRDRTPGTERGFRGSVDKGTTEFQSRNPRMRQNERHADRTVEPSRNKRENNRDHNTMRNAKGFDHHERTPEWMDYDPEAEITGKNKQADSNESEAEFINDLEAWKAKMKKQEKSNDPVQEQAAHVEPVVAEKAADIPAKPIETSPEQTKGNVKDNVDDLFAKLPSNLADTTMAFDNFVISGTGSRMSASASANTSNQGGSRFAKFFSSKQHETAPFDSPKEESASPMNDGTPKSISLDTLFQSHNAVPKPQGPPMPTGKRMLSENDILQSLGAHKPSPRQSDTVNDAAGFNKVLEALSKSKPVVLPPQNSPSQHEHRPSQNDQLRGMEPPVPTMNHRGGQMPMQQVPRSHNHVLVNNEMDADVGRMQSMQQIDPSILQQRRAADQQQHSPVLMRSQSYNDYPSHNSPGRARGNSPSAYSERPKMVASNLPTSVLRQLSAKSSDSPGKSGSPVANKQPTNFSPAHPRSLQASQYPQQPSDPALYGGGYNPMPMYQRGPPPVTGGYPGSPMEMAGGQNMNLEQLMQMRNNLHGGNIQSPPAQRGAVPPMPMMGNMPPFPPYMMGNPPPGSMQGPPPPGFPTDMRPPPKEHFIGMLPGANMSNPGSIPPQFYHQGPAGNGMGMNSRMMHPQFEEYERSRGEKS